MPEQVSHSGHGGMSQSYPSLISGLLANAAWLAAWSTAISTGSSVVPSARVSTRLVAKLAHIMRGSQISAFSFEAFINTMLRIFGFFMGVLMRE